MGRTRLPASLHLLPPIHLHLPRRPKPSGVLICLALVTGGRRMRCISTAVLGDFSHHIFRNSVRTLGLWMATQVRRQAPNPKKCHLSPLRASSYAMAWPTTLTRARIRVGDPYLFLSTDSGYHRPSFHLRTALVRVAWKALRRSHANVPRGYYSCLV
ncbi:hypothetical protein C8R46DRAFT_482332 [Mycena filopes]|nr:hypothetical protein C8R46DRAFT_482332 [Mycena filopes]